MVKKTFEQWIASQEDYHTAEEWAMRAKHYARLAVLCAVASMLLAITAIILTYK